MELIKWDDIEQARTYDELKSLYWQTAAYAYIRAGRILKRIQEEKKWEQAATKYWTFEEAVEKDFKITRQRAYYLIDATRIVDNLSTGVDKLLTSYPQDERGCRLLGTFDEKEQCEIWLEAQERAAPQTPTNTILREITQERKYEHLDDPDLPAGKYRILYADPPWKYSEQGLTGVSNKDEYGDVKKHYKQKSTEELCEMNVKELADDNAVLFLWVTSPFLEKSFKIIEAWGFEYKSSFIWDKVKHNFGYYNSVRHELLLICTKGSCTPDVKELFDSVQVIERTSKHSEKPEEFRKIIDTIYPKGKRIELFARKKVTGWDMWGNEV